MSIWGTKQQKIKLYAELYAILTLRKPEISLPEINKCIEKIWSHSG